MGGAGLLWALGLFSVVLPGFFSLISVKMQLVSMYVPGKRQAGMFYKSNTPKGDYLMTQLLCSLYNRVKLI